MINKFGLILLFTLGFLLAPSSTYACGSGKRACSKEISHTKKDCCSGHSHAKNGEGCGGKCGHKSCGCISGCITGAAILQDFTFNGFSRTSYFFKQNFYNPENTVSSGFYSLWLIPKIS